MQRRHFIRLVGGGLFSASAVQGLTGCSAALPGEALAAWQPQPEPAPGADLRHWVLSHAVLAPHSHNLQSWLLDLRQPGEITLHCDLNRLLPETDPYSRQIMMSQGTFLELLDLAARQRGLRADITLFPAGTPGPDRLDGQPTAHIRLVADATVKPDPLYAQIFRRRTNREAYDPRDPSPEALAAVADSVRSQPAWPVRTGFVTAAQPLELQRHREIAMQAWRIEMETPRTLLESYRWLRIGPAEIARHRDGISINSPMVRALAAVGLFDRSVVPPAGDAAIASQIRDFNAKLVTTPAFFYMVSMGNSRPTQVNTGRAYARAQLAATAQGLSMHPLQQALQEYPEQAGPYADIHERLQASRPGQTVQMWARLGHAPDIAPAPRRGLAAHLLSV